MSTVPYFPKRAVITGGMPYGEKTLHFGHVYGCHIHADIYARFLRDRIGKDNVIFVSGTDCYGAGPEVKYEALVKDGYTGSIRDFVESNHLSQKAEFETCGIYHNLYAASGLGEAGEIHDEVSNWVFETLHKGGYLRIEEVQQFYDDETGAVLNDRQVEGRCPIVGCKSEKAYASECGLGHQFNPQDLIAPIAVTSGKTPTLRAVKNWYFDLERFAYELKERQTQLRDEGISRKFMLAYIDDFLKDPAILVKTEDFDNLRKACTEMPEHVLDINEQNKSATITLKTLKDREEACAVLRAHGIRFRTGTTLVPFRLSGNVKWGIPVPEKDGIHGQTFWVWPESLWAPISFTQAYLKQTSGSTNGWEDWWFSPDARQYQFVGEDNIYFYAIAEMGMWMAFNEIADRDKMTNLPVIVPNRHALYLGKKASTSGAVKPPGAAQFLDHYTQEQLRMHFAHMALQSNSGSFNPKAVLEGKAAEGFDATLAEGNILTNVFNRLTRSCFYSLQKYFGGTLPQGEPSAETTATANTTITEHEWAMYRFEFSKVIDLMDVYLREANKAWVAQTKAADAIDKEGGDATAMRAQTLLDAFHAVRVAATLLHPFAPEGTQRVAEYLCFGDEIWSWEHIRKPMRFFMKDNHEFKFLEPRVDFFFKHPSQLG
ncbi:MAG: class I tRNA ligase family protein [Defluviitaleaceae bacterium]|nr:class I tRNA ligase family protein [Defluviitaleaceae bacterium]